MFSSNKDKFKSLTYQLMILFMEQHKLSRLGSDKKICEYIGGNEIVFNEFEIKQMYKYIIKNISQNYKSLFDENNFELTNDIVFGTLKKDHKYYKFDFEDGNVNFIMKDKGYRYQYNGYMRSEDKRNLQNKNLTIAIMAFTGITTAYYIGNWFVKDLDFLKFGEYVDKGLKFLNILYVDLFKFLVLFVVNLILVYYIAKFIKEKFNK